MSACQHSYLPPIHTIDYVGKSQTPWRIYQNSSRLKKFPLNYSTWFLELLFFCKQEFSQEFSSFPQVPNFCHPSLCESAGAGESDNKHPHLRSRLRGRLSAEVSQVSCECWHPWMGLIGQVCSDGNQARWRTLQLASLFCSKVITDGELLW